LSAQTQLDSNHVADLHWWKKHLESNPSRKLWPNADGYLDIWSADSVASWDSKLPTDVLVVTTDASGTGWGGVVSGLNLIEPIRNAGGFSDKQAGCTSNWRETKTQEIVLRKYGYLARGKRVLSLLDNTCGVAVLNKGHSSSHSLMAIARAIRKIKRDYDIEIIAKHIPGKDNAEADFLSRFTQDAYGTRVLEGSIVRAIEQAERCQVVSICQVTAPVGHPAYTVLQLDESQDAIIAQGPSLWCPGPHEFVGTLKRLKRLGPLMGPSHTVLVPYMPNSPWWGLLRGARQVKWFSTGTQLFEKPITVPVPNSSAPPVVLQHVSTTPWVACTFQLPRPQPSQPESQDKKRKRQHRGHRSSRR
jgi:hypothetical protein